MKKDGTLIIIGGITSFSNENDVIIEFRRSSGSYEIFRIRPDLNQSIVQYAIQPSFQTSAVHSQAPESSRGQIWHKWLRWGQITPKS